MRTEELATDLIGEGCAEDREGDRPEADAALAVIRRCGMKIRVEVCVAPAGATPFYGDCFWRHILMGKGDFDGQRNSTARRLYAMFRGLPSHPTLLTYEFHSEYSYEFPFNSYEL
jgi:hypothetical protein